MADCTLEDSINSTAIVEQPSKSHAKTLKTKAAKAWKKRPCALGRAKIDEGIAFMSKENNDLSKACELFIEAEVLCNSLESGFVKKSHSKGIGAERVDNLKSNESIPGTFPAPKRLVLPDPYSRIAKEHAKVPEAESFAINSPRLLPDGKDISNGFWRTRFPPEPNGYMHLGHAKAMHFDFLMAEGRGETYLRFDDTNPSAEKSEYIDSILDSVAWLGYKPSRVTYTSDYFNELHDLAVRLIERGKAYVCHMTKEDVRTSRERLKHFHLVCGRNTTRDDKMATPLPMGVESPWRDRPAKESLRWFEDMRCGHVDEGAAVLRMRGDLRSDISSMWDLVAYRVKKAPHPRTGRSWCVYPTYDFSHCIIDSLEGITHSFCDVNYVSRQRPNGPYYWLLHELGLFKPVTWEFGRCSLTYNVTSKRRLNKLVTGEHVSGWDDPRLLTLAGLRRRGYTASSINRFCAEIGTTRSDRVLHYHKLEALIRAELADVAPRKLCVLDPLRIDIVNHPGEVLRVEAPNHPSFPEMGSRSLELGRVVFIERSEFLEIDKEGFYGLAPGKTVRLLYAWDITCIGFDVGADGKVSHLRCTVNFESRESLAPKGKLHCLHWASDGAKKAEVRLYDHLFNVEKPGAKAKRHEPAHGLDAADPNELARIAKTNDACDSEFDLDEMVDDNEVAVDEDAFVAELNLESMIVHDNALVEPSLVSLSEMAGSFQFTRLGYFCVDKDSSTEAFVFNRTCTLKESSELKALR